jgi:hypothetical protein
MALPVILASAKTLASFLKVDWCLKSMAFRLRLKGATRFVSQAHYRIVSRIEMLPKREFFGQAQELVEMSR